MKNFRRIIAVSLCLGLFLTALFVLAESRSSVISAANASPLQDDESFWIPCSLQTIHGRYGTETTGYIVSAGPLGPVADVGVISFDGAGNAAQTSTVSLNGVIIQHRSSLSGTYTVNPDCTGSTSLMLPSPAGPIPSTSDFVIVGHGQELRTIVTGAGRVLAGTARRQ